MSCIVAVLLACHVGVKIQEPKEGGNDGRRGDQQTDRTGARQGKQKERKGRNGA